MGEALGLLLTALLLGLRHGIDWDHIAAITDITSTTAAGEAGEAGHEEHHRAGEHDHDHGGAAELDAHAAAAGAAGEHTHEPVAASRRGFAAEQREAIWLGSLYALGHASVNASSEIAWPFSQPSSSVVCANSDTMSPCVGSSVDGSSSDDSSTDESSLDSSLASSLD